MRYRFLASARAAELMDASLEGNRAVATAIHAGDGDTAGAATRRMIRHAWSVIGRVDDDEEAVEPAA